MMKMNDIPAKITPTQYDTLMHRLWELEQKVATQDKVILNTVELDKLIVAQDRLQRLLEKQEETIRMLVSSVDLLLRAENARQRVGSPAPQQVKPSPFV